MYLEALIKRRLSNFHDILTGEKKRKKPISQPYFILFPAFEGVS